MSVGDLGNRETRQIISQRLGKAKIDISTIQETHQTCNGEWGGGIHLLFGSSAEMKMAQAKEAPIAENQNGIGEAIIITKELSENILEITRANAGIIMKIRLRTNIHG